MPLSPTQKYHSQKCKCWLGGCTSFGLLHPTLFKECRLAPYFVAWHLEQGLIATAPNSDERAGHVRIIFVRLHIVGDVQPRA